MLTEIGLLRLGLFAAEAVAAGTFVISRKKTKGAAKKQLLTDKKNQERTERFTELFKNMGLMDPSKGDWIKAIEFKANANYSQVAFKLSDTLSCEGFIKAKARLKEKLDKKHLEIYYENGKMYFRARYENIPLLPYCYKPGPKHLVPLGLNIDDEVIYWCLSQEPHMLICGSTGSGKSRMLNAALDHIIHNNKPMLYLIDLKRGLEFGVYRNLKYTVAYAELLKDVDKVIGAFELEGDRRFELLREAGYNDYNDYIKDHPNSNLTRAYLVIDEFADIVRNKNSDIIDRITELAAKVRCCGMHLVISTQRPTTDFISASTKASLQCIVGMKAVNEHNSRLIIDETGLEELQRAEAIGIISSKKVFFRAFKFNTDISKATAEQFKKVG